jgi:hypothetical protein
MRGPVTGSTFHYTGTRGVGTIPPLPACGSRRFDSLECDCFAHLHDEMQINAKCARFDLALTRTNTYV